MPMSTASAMALDFHRQLGPTETMGLPTGPRRELTPPKPMPPMTVGGTAGTQKLNLLGMSVSPVVAVVGGLAVLGAVWYFLKRK
jgi:hypothetical protein